MTHTPGPWSSFGIYVTTEAGDTLARAEYSHCSLPEARANARVMAAAPDLLEALKALRDGAYGNPSMPEENARIDAMADAAIAKAEGR